jgi:serine/threonine-protein kinase
VCRYGRRTDYIKVLDFGLVKAFRPNAVSGPQATKLTAENSIIGTPAFMAPEVSLNSSKVDLRSDIYAIGCVAYYLATGKMVFETELPIDPEFDSLILACLAKEPDSRP